MPSKRREEKRREEKKYLIFIANTSE